MTRVIVVGGGVMGAAAAWRLTLRGAEVVLLEQFEPGHDRGSSHGSSRIFRLAYADERYVALAVRAYELWSELQAETGRDVLTLTGGVDHGPLSELEPMLDALMSQGQTAQLITPDEAAERWAGLRFDTAVLHHRLAGRTHADDSVAAFTAAAEKRGAEIRHGIRVERIVADSADRVEVISTDGEVIAGDAVVLAAGPWASSVFTGLVPALARLWVTQEQPAHFPPLDATQTWPTMIHHAGAALSRSGRTEHGAYGLPSADGIKLGFHISGPTVDPDQRDRTIVPAVENAVADYARTWVPGVDWQQPESLTCLYTMTPDADFVIDRRGPVTVLAGFSGHGFKFAPAVGELAAGLVFGDRGPEQFASDRLALKSS